MSDLPARTDVTVGITNTRLSAVKRGIAVQLATRLADETETEVCLVGADPTDRDVQRCLPALRASGEYRRMEIRHGPYSVEVTQLLGRNLTVVLLSDRAVIEAALTRLREIFRFIVIDAPSRVGSGVGIARVLPPFLDSLVVASSMRAGEIALTQAYVDALESAPVTRHLELRVVLEGTAADSGFGAARLQRKLARLPLFDERRASVMTAALTPFEAQITPRDARDNIECLVEWTIGLQEARGRVRTFDPDGLNTAVPTAKAPTPRLLR